MIEVWKDIPQFEGLYQVSNMGRIRSLPHITKCGNYTRTTGGRILKQNPDLRGGYFLVYLSKYGKVKCFKVHRLVAICFCDGYTKRAVVNHKDGNRGNNVYSNLEWCSQKQNIHHSINTLGNTPGCGTGKNHPFSLSIIQLNTDNSFVRKFDSIRDVERILGYDSSSICKVLKGKRAQAYGYKWKYENEYGNPT